MRHPKRMKMSYIVNFSTCRYFVNVNFCTKIWKDCIISISKDNFPKEGLYIKTVSIMGLLRMYVDRCIDAELDVMSIEQSVFMHVFYELTDFCREIFCS